MTYKYAHGEHDVPSGSTVFVLFCGVTSFSVLARTLQAFQWGQSASAFQHQPLLCPSAARVYDSVCVGLKLSLSMCSVYSIHTCT